MQPIINEMDFSEKVIEVQGKVLVEFFATWCPHCKRQQPITDEVASIVDFPVYQVDVDQSPELARTYAPHGFPTYVLFQNGEVMNSHAGECPLGDVLMFVGE